jgi:hypothetical protein
VSTKTKVDFLYILLGGFLHGFSTYSLSPLFPPPKSYIISQREQPEGVEKDTHSVSNDGKEKRNCAQKERRNGSLVVEGALNSREYRRTDSPRVPTPVVMYSVQELDGNEWIIQKP